MTERPSSKTPNGPRENRIGSFEGIKFFSGTAIPKPATEIFTRLDSLTVGRLREELHVWRPEETIEAGKTFFKDKKLLVIGSPQSGKGTILFGLSEICDVLGFGYVFINGHHQETTAQKIEETIQKADENGIAIFYDSFDYLFVRGKMRKINREEQQQRTKTIIKALKQISTPLALTMHDQTWQEYNSDQTLLEKHQDFLSTFPIFDIPLNLQSNESIRRFLVDNGINEKYADSLLSFDNRPETKNILMLGLRNKNQADAVLEATKSYPVLKLLTRDKKPEFEKLMEELSNNPSSQEILLSIARLILDCQMETVFLTVTRKKK